VNSVDLPEWVKLIVVGQYSTNCYLISDFHQCLVIDPGGDGEKIFRSLPEGKEKISILLTHGHADHWAGLSRLEEFLPEAEVFYPEGDEEFLKKPNLHFLRFLGGEVPQNLGEPISPHGEFRIGELHFSVLHLPGHTPGHLALYGNGLLFAGDVVFKDGVGRTDFPGGSAEDLRSSLKLILSLPPETIICPGHGPLTTVKEVQGSLGI
jgi:glyoxylase-like metal-dependent hydrolase (beta-lactamase superfamily II)